MPFDTPLRMLLHALFRMLPTAFHADDQMDCTVDRPPDMNDFTLLMPPCTAVLMLFHVLVTQLPIAPQIESHTLWMSARPFCMTAWMSATPPLMTFWMMLHTFAASDWMALQTEPQSPLMTPKTIVMMSWIACMADVTMAEMYGQTASITP